MPKKDRKAPKNMVKYENNKNSVCYSSDFTKKSFFVTDLQW